MPAYNPLWEIIEPYLIRLGLYTVPDPTYGRYTHPPHLPHLPLVGNSEISQTYRRIFLPSYGSFNTFREAYDCTNITHAEDVKLTQDEVKSGALRGGRWIVYSTWEMEQPPKGGWEAGGRGRGNDLVLLHGLSDYGLRYAPHVQHFLNAGFRVILPDLPSYGRSTGVHSYLPSLMLLPAAVHAVLTDVVQKDLDNGRRQRKVFLSGSSMGGWAILYYLLKYPPTSSPITIAASSAMRDIKPPDPGHGQGYDDSERPRDEEKLRLRVAGAFIMCPMVEVAKDSRPSLITEYIGRAIVLFAGMLPLAKAAKGKTSDDPAIEADHEADSLCYQGWLRVGTGLALVEGMIELEKRANEINIPIRLIHGSADRVTSHLGTLRLFDRLSSEDKEVEIYPGLEHVMIRVGRDAEDDAPRQAILADWRSWLLQRC